MDLAERSQHNHRHPWEITRASAVISLIKKIKTLDSPLRVLDIGCGDGFVLDQLKKIFPLMTADGIDINLSQQDILERSTDTIQYSNTIPASRNHYDLILLMDVLEHIQCDVKFLKNISKYASTETFFIVTVPAYQRLFTAHDIFLKHYRRYNTKLLLQTISSAGLTPLKQGTFFFSLLLPRLLEHFSDHILSLKRPPSKGIGHWDKNTFLTKLIICFLNTDNMTLLTLNTIGIQLPGLSLWTIAKLK